MGENSSDNVVAVMTERAAEFSLPQIVRDNSQINFAKLMKLIVDDANGTPRATNAYKKYSRDQILKYLADPIRNAASLVSASIYLYTSVLLYRRICNYLAALPLYDYILYPIGLADNSSADQYRSAYYKALAVLETMNVEALATDMMTVCIREGAYYGVELYNKDSYMIYRFPQEYCRVTSWEAGCPLFSLNMTYFDRTGMELTLESMPDFVQKAYRTYKSNSKMRWAEMPSTDSVCIIADKTIETGVAVPMLVGCFPDLYVLDEYKDLVKAKSIIDIYKLLYLKVPTDDKGNILIDEKLLGKWYSQVAGQLPDSVGLGMGPMDIEAVTFEKDANDIDMTSRAERDLFSGIGISQMVMSNSLDSASAIKNSIINDYLFVRPVLLNIQDWLNKKLRLSGGLTKFQLKFLDGNSYTKDTDIATLEKSLQYGLPVRMILSAMGAGYTPMQTVGMNFLETDVLELHTKLIPPQSANTMAGDGGRPTQNVDKLTPEGNRAKEQETKVVK